ncbi:hypothetical protein NSTC745_01998 [Nostoc sp. DSM 114161]|jgi:hypothetical protein
MVNEVIVLFYFGLADNSCQRKKRLRSKNLKLIGLADTFQSYAKLQNIFLIGS